MPSYSAALSSILDREPRPPGGITTTDVDYEVDGAACAGFLALPAGDGPAPGVLVVHDWLGVGDYVRMRCEMLARLGYVAFAGDIYGADTRPGPADAAAVAGGFYGDKALFRARLTGAFDRLLAEDRADATRTAAIGYCFGGSGVLELARTGADVSGVVSFHGGLQPGPEGEAQAIRAKILIQTGAIDPVVPDDAVVAIENEFRAVAHLDWQVTAYSGAMHAFTQPDANSPDFGAQYNAAAERRSWQAMKGFFAELF